MRRLLALLTGLALLTPIARASAWPASRSDGSAQSAGLWIVLGLIALPLMGWALLREARLRRRIQAAVENERAEVEAILTSVPAAVLVSTRERVVRANPLALKTLGVEKVDVLAPPEVVAERLQLRGLEETPLAFEKAVLEPGLAGETGTTEVLAQVHGREQTFQVAFGPVRRNHGIDAVVGVFTDVTELRQKDRALRLSEARLAAVVSLAADAILCVHERGEIVLANQAAESLLGESLTGAQLGKWLSGTAALSTVLRGEGVRNEELTAFRASGESFPVELSSTRIEVEGEVLYSVLLRDVSERRRRELEQRVLGELGAALTSSLEREALGGEIAKVLATRFADWSLVDLFDENGLTAKRIAVASREPDTFELGKRLQNESPEPGRRHLGFEAHATRRPVLYARLSADFLRSCCQTEAHGRLLNTLQPHSALVIPLLAQGQVIGTVSLLRTKLGSFGAEDVIFAEEISRRVTLALENAVLYREARRATAARDRMLSLVAHDLRNPLHSILILTQNLSRQQWVSSEGESIDPSLEAIIRSARQMNRLIADLLCAEQLEKGKLGLRREAVAPGSLVEMALEDIAPLAQDHAIEADVERNLPEVQADPSRVLQVLSNLLGNALKFSPQQGRIRLSVKRDGDQARFSVTDSGPGIPAEVRSRLFQPFWQLNRDSRGVGLGLWIARQIVEAHQGRIWVEGQEGAGATLCFSLPLCREEALALAAG